MAPPRIAPVDNPSAEVQDMLRKTTVGTERDQALNIFRTLAHHPLLLQRFNALGGAFMRHGSLPTRLRELVILRVAWVSQCDYEWGQHVEIARGCGISPEEIDAVAQDHAGTRWSNRESAAFELVDQLVSTATVDDALWARLSASFNTPELIELILLVGFYRMAAGLLNAAAVEREPWLTPLPEVVHE